MTTTPALPHTLISDTTVLDRIADELAKRFVGVLR
jgi:hypothetical protein